MALKYQLFCCLLLGRLLWPAASAEAQAQIAELSRNDFIFKQLTTDIEENNKRLASGKEPLPLIFYSYTLKENDSLYRLAARLNISYDSIVTLNGIASPLLFNEYKTIFIPNMSGIAIRTNEKDTFIHQVAQRLTDKEAYEGYIYANETVNAVRFYPNERFTQHERRIFLSGFFRSPLNGQLITTSAFGQRTDPLGSGSVHHHNGIDLRAAIGSPAYAARSGTVVGVMNNPILGLYIIIQHEAGYQSVYGHLSAALVKKGAIVKTGELIARTGNTGASTGPHLHFEVRKYGKAINPAALINSSVNY
jgi:murein DD-endopeptidase MepM/ murein hydrolase activator NlpD